MCNRARAAARTKPRNTPEFWVKYWGPKHDSTIYFICSGEFVKVGLTRHLKRRLHTMQTNTPHELKVLHTLSGDRKKERAFHELLRPYHFRGEWYRLTGDLAKFLELVGVP